MSEEPETKSAETPKTEPEQDAAAKTEEAADKTPEEPPKEMRAVVLTGFGGLKTVKIQKKPEPATLAEGDVLIRVKSCGVNFLDVMARLGLLDSLPKNPFIMGFECAGVVEKTHENVENFKVGDRVMALPECGAWAELVAVPQQYVFAIPAELSFAEATAFMTSFVIAHILLFDLGGLAPGKSVLIDSAGGGVGQAVAQLCKTVKDVVVFGVASKVKHEAIKSSVDHVLERGTDYLSEVRKVSPEGVDLFLDCVYGEDCNKGYSALKPLGRYVLYGSSGIVTGETKSLFSAARSWWRVDKIIPIKLFDENKTLSGLNLRRLLHRQNGSAYINSTYQKVLALWRDKQITPLVDSTFALEDVAEAMQTIHDRKNVGRIVLDLSLEPKPKPATPAKGKAKNNDKDEKKKEEDENKENKENKDSPDAEKKENTS